MTVNEKELLSALVDGELTGKELDRAIDLLTTNEELRDNWQRYQFNKDVIQGNVPAFRCDISQSISQAIANEPEYAVKQKAKIITLPNNFWKQTISLAMAASIGALAVVGVISAPQQSLEPLAPVNLVKQTASPQLQYAVTEPKSNRWTVGEPELENRLNDYLVDHHEYVGTSGVFSYARVVSYGAGQ